MPRTTASHEHALAKPLLLGLAAAGLMFALGTTPHQAQAAWFYDAPAGYWATDGGYIDYVSEVGLMTGIANADGSPTGLFMPEESLTRGQVATILYRYANPGSSATTNPNHYAAHSSFTDVSPYYYYTAAIEWCYENGIVTGYLDGATQLPTGMFGPEDVVTRSQLCTMVTRFSQLYGIDVSGGFSTFWSFPDAAEVPDWAAPSMAWCTKEGIVSGSNEAGSLYLRPYENATRAQAAKIITVLTRDIIENKSTYEYVVVAEQNCALGTYLPTYGLRYYGAGAYITGYRGGATSVVLPAEVDGLPVVGAVLGASSMPQSVTELTAGPNNTSLAYLSVNGNASLTSISIANAPLLAALELSDCPALAIVRATSCARLADVSLLNCNALQTTVFNFNASLVNLAFSNCPSLSYHSSSTCENLAWLSFANCPSLATVVANNCALTSFDASSLPSLTHLVCSNNKIADTSELEAWLALDGHTGSVTPQQSVLIESRIAEPRPVTLGMVEAPRDAETGQPSETAGETDPAPSTVGAAGADAGAAVEPPTEPTPTDEAEDPAVPDATPSETVDEPVVENGAAAETEPSDPTATTPEETVDAAPESEVEPDDSEPEDTSVQDVQP